MREVETSQSGALFAAFSDWFMEQKGIVYGAAYTDGFRVVHKRAASKPECKAFKGSKYVQSDLNAVFPQVKQDLDCGVKVLFSGTPCQTAGLRRYLCLLNTDLTNLYLCDVICHGVPGPYCWRDYAAYIEKKHGRKITNANFRDKSFGWRSHKESFVLDDTYTYTYTYIFYTSINLRRSCGICPFTNFKRPSDISLGDFWEHHENKRVYQAFDADNKGISLVLVNTAKGLRLFEAVKDNIRFIESGADECLQPNLLHPTEIHPKRDQFEEDYRTHDYAYIIKKYGNAGVKEKLRHQKDLALRTLRRFEIFKKTEAFLRGGRT
jgi:coenzyme F420-reducing hydrogenase beta subunit